METNARSHKKITCSLNSTRRRYSRPKQHGQTTALQASRRLENSRQNAHRSALSFVKYCSGQLGRVSSIGEKTRVFMCGWVRAERTSGRSAADHVVSAQKGLTKTAMATHEQPGPDRFRFCRHRGLLRQSGDANSCSNRPMLLVNIGTRGLAAATGLAAVLWAGYLLGANFGKSGAALVSYAGVVAFIVSVGAASLAVNLLRLVNRLRAQVSQTTDMGMYQLESRIGFGGMGEVWRARHRLLSRPAAIKLIRQRPDDDDAPPNPRDQVSEIRFEREAQVTASLRSPHTVELFDFGVTDNGTIYYVMELLEGDNLEELVKREGPLEPERVIHLLKQVLDSLAEAHARGLVHRDIKPANLHVSHRGLEPDFVKVLDFGLVKNGTLDNLDLKLTAANDVIGTPAYAAPEVITGESVVDGRADLYSLGCVAYYLLTGTRVFEADSAISMAVAHAAEAPEPLSQRLGRELPPDLEQLVLACLAKSPADRPSSAVELLTALRRIERHLADTHPTSSPTSVRRERAIASNAFN